MAFTDGRRMLKQLYRLVRSTCEAGSDTKHATRCDEIQGPCVRHTDTLWLLHICRLCMAGVHTVTAGFAGRCGSAVAGAAKTVVATLCIACNSAA
jgi:hypothetical protein